ncbi:ferredoxin reductase-like protein [Wallemia mellicola]|nr:ferredoxin reductase-like protein [Wallemia mellicola]TIC30300.1 ferredoxin reductase-like protein [Wallemia mellicola]TIC75723.1 ferredoxin reductase-like protein [Wallemia mellicola]
MFARNLQSISKFTRSYSTGPQQSSKGLYIGAKLNSAGALALFAGGYTLLNKDSSSGPLPASTSKSDRIESLQTPQVALTKENFTNLTLKNVKKYNHDSSIFEFELPGSSVSGLETAGLVVVKAADDSVKGDNGKPVIRPYTPISTGDTRGQIDFLIKKYDDGKFTPYIHSLKPGDQLAIKGPLQKFKWVPNTYEKIGLIAGGSGITPMTQLAETILNNPEDKTKVTLLFANKTPEDILLKETLDDWKKKYPEQFNVVYTIDKETPGWDGLVGYFTGDILKKNLPAPGSNGKTYVCGPPPMMKAISGNKTNKGAQGELTGILKELGYTEDQIFKY